MTPSPARQDIGELQFASEAASVASGDAPAVSAPPDLNGNGRHQSTVASIPLDAEHLALRLGLQRRASSNIRRHLLRHLRRVSVLLVADFVAITGLGLVLASLEASGVGLIGDIFRR